MALLGLLMAGCQAGPSAGSANRALAEKYVNSFNSANMQGILDVVADDVNVYVMGGNKPEKGKDTLANLLNYDFPFGTQLRVDKWSEEGDTVKAQIYISSPKTQQVTPMNAVYSWTVKNGKISEIHIDRAP